MLLKLGLWGLTGEMADQASFLLLADGASFLLLADSTSKLQRP